MLTSDLLLKALSRTDGHYRKFEQYQRFGLLPLSNIARALSVHLSNLYDLIYDDDESLDLVLALMAKFAQEADKKGTRVVFMILPERSTVFPGGWRRWLPDHYGKMVEEMRAHGFVVLDGRQVLRDCKTEARQLYSEDMCHYSVSANRLLGHSLKAVLVDKFDDSHSGQQGTDLE